MVKGRDLQEGDVDGDEVEVEVQVQALCERRSRWVLLNKRPVLLLRF